MIRAIGTSRSRRRISRISTHAGPVYTTATNTSASTRVITLAPCTSRTDSSVLPDARHRRVEVRRVRRSYRIARSRTFARRSRRSVPSRYGLGGHRIDLSTPRAHVSVRRPSSLPRDSSSSSREPATRSPASSRDRQVASCVQPRAFCGEHPQRHFDDDYEPHARSDPLNNTPQCRCVSSAGVPRQRVSRMGVVDRGRTQENARNEQRCFERAHWFLRSTIAATTSLWIASLQSRQSSNLVVMIHPRMRRPHAVRLGCLPRAWTTTPRGEMMGL